MVKDILKNAEDRMKKAVETLREELSKVRTGKATTVLLDGIKVEYYGSTVPLTQVANLSTPDVHTITVQPWEKNMLAVIDKAILNAGLSLNPVNDGNVLRVPVPPLNEERRKEYVKLARRYGEEQKIAIRNIRRDAIEHLKKSEKQEHFSEDERKRGEQESQKLTDKYIKDVESLLATKEKEIMEV